MLDRKNASLERIQEFVRKLAFSYYAERLPMRAVCTVSDSPIPFGELSEREWQEIRPGECWGRAWQSAWFRFAARVPEGWRDREVVAVIDTGSEACLFDDAGNPVCGLTSRAEEPDPLLRKALLPLYPKAAGGEAIELLVEAAASNIMGVQAEARLRSCELAIFRRDLWDLVHDAVFLSDLAAGLPESSPRYASLLNALFRAAGLYGDGAPEEVAGCRRILQAELAQAPGSSAPRVSAIGHTHLDVAWLWPLSETVRKAGRSFSSAIRYMSEYPEYRFGASQPQVYQFVKDHYPGLYSKIRTAAAEGRWEPLGAMWVEPDVNITGAEALVRQIFYGKKFFREELGVEVDNVWLPDTFGFTPALPQIMRRSGLRYFLSQKLSWSLTNRFPHHLFRWEGLDGSTVLAHFLPTDTMNSTVRPGELLYGMGNFEEKESIRRWLYLFGEGDGGGGPGRHHLEFARRARECEGLPRVTIEPARDFFRKVEQEVLERETESAPGWRAPEWRGELYLERHQGTLTTGARIKRYNRLSERALHDLEFTCLTAHLLGSASYPQSLLEEMWKTLLLNQFHDILPATTIDRAYRESLAQFEALLSGARDLLERTLQGLCGGQARAGRDSRILLVNSASFDAERVFFLPITDLGPDQGLADRDGRTLPVQRGREGIFVAARLPGCGFLSLDRKTGAGAENGAAGVTAGVTVSERHLENSRLRVELAEDGSLSRIFDKEANRELLPPGQRGNRLLAFRDALANNDAWDIDPWYRRWEPAESRLLSTRIWEEGPLCSSLMQQRAIGDSEIHQEIRLYRDSKRIEFRTRVHWVERQKMLKVRFPLDIHADMADFDIQFGNFKRPTHRNTSWDQARLDVFAHKWADLSEWGYGAALLNDCKYGYSVDKNILELTLLRSPREPNPEVDRGDHTFVYALLPHAGDFRYGGVIDEGYLLNHPVFSWEYPAGAGTPAAIERLSGRSLFSTGCPGVVIETLKKAETEDAVVVRLYEAFGRRVAVRFRSAFPVRDAAETDLLENEAAGLDVEPDSGGSAIPFIIKPYEIKTLRLRLAT